MFNSKPFQRIFRLTVALIALSICSDFAFAQFGDDPFSRPRPAVQEPEGRKAPKAEPREDQPAPEKVEPEIELPPTYVKLYLLDGDIVSGELETASIAIATEFGNLSVPIKKIIRFEPGLNSYPKVIADLNQLVEDLGSTKYDVRQAAHKKLVLMGPRVRNELAKFKDGGNAERKRHLEEIKKEIAKNMEELDEDELERSENQPWVKDDRLVTSTFTAVGKIQQNEFKLAGKYGQLNIKLSDIQKGMRPLRGKQSIARSLTLSKDNFVQLTWKSVGTVVEKGDVISVTATGSMMCSPWGSNVSSTPNGMPQYGMMPNTPGIPYGALVAKIGNGKYFMVGQKKTFRADSKGKLQFAITMNRSYVGRSYKFPGDYKVKVKIEPSLQQ